MPAPPVPLASHATQPAAPVASVIEVWGAGGAHSRRHDDGGPEQIELQQSAPSDSTLSPLPLRLCEVASVPLGRCVDAPPLIVRLARAAPLPDIVLAVVGTHACEVVAIDATRAVEAESDCDIAPRASAPPSLPLLLAPLWRCPLPDRVEGGASVHWATATAAVGCYDGAVYGVSLDSGALAWRHPEPTAAAAGAQAHPLFPWLHAGGLRPHREKGEGAESSPGIAGDDTPAGPVPSPGEPIKCSPLVEACWACGAAGASCTCPDGGAALCRGGGVVWSAGYDRVLQAFEVCAGRGLLPQSTRSRAHIHLAGSVIAAPVQITLLPVTKRAAGGAADRGWRLIVVACTSGDLYAVDRDAAFTASDASSVAAHRVFPGPLFATPLVVCAREGSAASGGTAPILIAPCADRSIYGVTVVRRSHVGGVGFVVTWRVETGAPCFAPPSLVPWALQASDTPAHGAVEAQGGAAMSTGGGGTKRRRELQVVAESTSRHPAAVVGSHDGRLRCIDARTGAVLWSTAVASGSPSAPIAAAASYAWLPELRPAGGRLLLCVIVAATDGSVRVLSAATGEYFARDTALRLPGEVFSSPAAVQRLSYWRHGAPVSDSESVVIFVGCRDDRMHVLQMTREPSGLNTRI